MAARTWIMLCLALFLATARSTGIAAPPRVVDERYQLELIVSEPQIVTPIGVAFDRQGRLLVVESHTHERPTAYKGPASDRIRMLADSNGDGRLDHWSTFADGFRHAMNVLVRPDGGVYVVERNAVRILRDTDGNGQADKTDDVLRLITKTDYPHNGLGGIAHLQDSSDLLVSLGENFGAAYRLKGSDGKSLVGQGGAGGIFRCSSDGANLERIAIGFWNPFGICVLPDGRIFAVDNDPDSRPPCRLLHIVPGGDYGFIWQYGRPGIHPLQAWNGELPGTLPMVCGVGEAPTAIIAHKGWLWVSSWGDHRIERYRLVPRGESYAAERQVVVQGGVDFRPTGMAFASDGSLYFGDWIRLDYGVHGQGRVWRLAARSDDIIDEAPLPPKVQPVLAQSGDIDTALASDDPFVRTAGVWVASHANSNNGVAQNPSPNPRVRLGRLDALHWMAVPNVVSALQGALRDPSADVRLYAIRWIANERIAELRDDVAALLNGSSPEPRLHLAILGAIDWLDHGSNPRGSGITDQLLVSELSNEQRSPASHALTLSLLSPDDNFLSLDRLRNYLHANFRPLRLEAVRSLAQQSNPDRFSLLASVARDDAQDDEVRAEAIVGLAAAAEKHRQLLEVFASGSDRRVLKSEAQRMLRLGGLGVAPAESKPSANDLNSWNVMLKDSGNAAAGRRLFFSSVGPRCSVCHRYGGRGGRVGPDLTNIGMSNSRESVIASILQPSREIAPHYQAWVLVTRDGKTYTGLRLPKPGDDGNEDYVDSAGATFTLPSHEIDERLPSATSIMPENLATTLSIADLRDLVTFLTQPH
jgi:putative membrane-bound dehydrogenase-like protein